MTLSLLLIPYGLGLIIYGVLSTFAITNLVTFGTKNFTTFLITFSYILTSVITLFFWYLVLTNIAWSTPIVQNGFTLPP